jgi:hypothetical protein
MEAFGARSVPSLAENRITVSIRESPVACFSEYAVNAVTGSKLAGSLFSTFSRGAAE